MKLSAVHIPLPPLSDCPSKSGRGVRSVRETNWQFISAKHVCARVGSGGGGTGHTPSWEELGRVWGVALPERKEVGQNPPPTTHHPPHTPHDALPAVPLRRNLSEVATSSYMHGHQSHGQSQPPRAQPPKGPSPHQLRISTPPLHAAWPTSSCWCTGRVQQRSCGYRAANMQQRCRARGHGDAGASAKGDARQGVRRVVRLPQSNRQPQSNRPAACMAANTSYG